MILCGPFTRTVVRLLFSEIVQSQTSLTDINSSSELQHPSKVLRSDTRMTTKLWNFIPTFSCNHVATMDNGYWFEASRACHQRIALARFLLSADPDGVCAGESQCPTSNCGGPPINGNKFTSRVGKVGGESSSLKPSKAASSRARFSGSTQAAAIGTLPPTGAAEACQVVVMTSSSIPLPPRR